MVVSIDSPEKTQENKETEKEQSMKRREHVIEAILSITESWYKKL